MKIKTYYELPQAARTFLPVVILPSATALAYCMARSGPFRRGGA